MKVQISFAKEANLERVKEQLIDLAKDKSLEFYSCFLPRTVVEEKGFSTDILDTIDEALDGRMNYMLEGDTFDDVMADLPDRRKVVGALVDKLYVLDSTTASGVADEIAAYTEGRVILLK